MAELKWDEIGKRFYETGVRHGVLYIRKPDGDYDTGVAWNGLISISKSPDGAEANDIYADDIKYLTLRSAENFKATIEAYTYPDEFIPCEGIVIPVPGVYLDQQPMRPFALCFRTILGNDIENDDYAYKIHILYNCTSSPSEKAYQTINENPEAAAFSWEISSIPLIVEGFNPTATITIDSSKVNAYDLSILEAILYGTELTDPELLLPDELADVFRVGFLLDEDDDYILFGGDRIGV